ncbi:hypothetical protein ACMD2_09482 [Ananas comosus]|uniref:Uncharacterized protein n=1 Tax=Ananas comosus TaxID=4615 RepID=A0A199V7E3_ANACO|nr:hypothetical protein ACMD2_09482 [Ananas comosus]
MGPAGGMTSLDPTEEKLLFGSDDDNTWKASLGSSTGVCSQGNSFNNDCFNALPSLNSGSWSALMQEALQESSSDNGLQEQWSGVNLQNTEQSIINHSSIPNDNEKQPTTWNDHFRPESHSGSAGLQFSSQSMQGVWVSRQKMPFDSVSRQSNDKLVGGNSNRSPVTGGNTASKLSDNDSSIWKATMPARNNLMQYEDRNAVVMNSNTLQAVEEPNQKVHSKPQNYYGNHFVGNSSVVPSDAEDLGRNQNQPTQKSFSPSTQHNMGSHMLQNHLVGSVVTNTTTNQPFYSQGMPHSVDGGSNNLGKRYVGHSKVAAGVASNNSLDFAERTIPAEERRAIPRSDLIGSIFDGSAALYSQNKTVQASQNMPGLLQKMDQSINSNAVSTFHVPKPATAGDAASDGQLNQPFSLQNFGLRLAPPSQRQPISGHTAHQTSLNDFSGKDGQFPQGDEDQAQETSTNSFQSLHATQGAYQRANVDNKSSVPGQPYKETSCSQNKVDSPTITPSDPSCRHQKQSPSSTGHESNSKYPGFPFGIQNNANTSRALENSESHSAEIDNNRQWNAGFPQNRSDQQVDNRSGSQPPISGISQQAGLPTMFKNVWTNLSAQRIAGLQPNKLTPDVLQVLILANNTRQANLWGLPKVNDFGKKGENASSDIGTSSSNALNQENRHVMGHFEMQPSSEKVAVVLKKGIASQGQEALQKHLTYQNPDQNDYSLLRQMHAMRSTDVEPSDRFGKRLKGAEFGSDTSLIDQRQNSVVKASVDNKLAGNLHDAYPSEVKMLSFASSNNEDNGVNVSSQLSGREASSPDMHIARFQNSVHSFNPGPASHSVEGSEHPKISPQIDPSWFEQHGIYRNGHTLAMQYNLPKVSGSLNTNILAEKKLNSGQFGIIEPGMVSAIVPTRPKKRKAATPEPLSWHKVIEGSQGQISIRMAELNWARAANRLIEKVEDEAEMLEDGPLISPPRKRLILTTQLMQHLLPAAPGVFLKAEAASAYENVTYSVAKLALGDACNLISCSRSYSCVQQNNEHDSSETEKNAKKVEGNFLSRVVEEIIGRTKKLENDFIRLDKRTSLLDVRLECQDLERFSMVNRLGKFHGQSQSEKIDGSSTSTTAPRKTLPQRYVTGFSVSGNIPEGMLCFSL